MPLDAIAPKKSWIRRNWIWVVSVWLALAFVGLVLAFLAMANSAARDLAITTAEASPALTARLGKPLQFGWFTSGQIEVNEAGGHAELAIRVSGPKDKGTLYVEAKKEAGIWGLELLQFAPSASGNRIDLLKEAETLQKPSEP